jgi:uncharacterized protein (DUF1800 family)
MNISRRDFLKASGLFAAWTALSSCAPHEHFTAAPTTAPFSTALPAPSLEPLEGDALLIHALKRISFGPTSSMIEKARQRGLPVQELIAATLLRQWHSERQLFETMVEFWSDHFSIFIGKNACRVLKTDDDLKAIRPNALGKFRDLLYASAHSPAMLIYLDQAESRGEAPNENYARELMELHTIGVESGYTHHDVEQVALAFTGWTVSGPRQRVKEFGSFYFNPQIHDNSEKHVLGMMIQSGGEDEGMP